MNSAWVGLYNKYILVFVKQDRFSSKIMFLWCELFYVHYYNHCLLHIHCDSTSSTPRGWRVGGLQPPKKSRFKNSRFCRHENIRCFTWFTFSCNQPLKLADGKCIRILKSKIKKCNFLGEIKKQSRLSCLLN